MDEKPWHAIAREYLGWLNFVTWPYRGYQWIKYFLSKRASAAPRSESAPTPEATKPPEKVWDGERWIRPHTPKHKPGAQLKLVEYHPFLGSFGVLAALLGFGGFIIFLNVYNYYEKPYDVEQIKFSISGVLVGLILLFFGFRYWVTRSRRITYAKAPPAPRNPNGPPPTVDETRRAHNHLRLAIAYKQERMHAENTLIELEKLNDASMELAKARSLDPAVTAQDPESDFTYTQDYLASELLFLEASLLSSSPTPSEGDLQRARKAIERALLYLPGSILYMRLAMDIYEKEGATWAMRDMLKKALAIAPDDLNLLKLQSRLDA